MEEQWLVYSREHNAFWRANNSGYTYELKAAGRYSKADADANCTCRDPQRDGSPSEIALPAPEYAEQLKARVAELEGALRQAEEWLEGWASAEPYLGEIRAVLAKPEGKP